MSHQSRVRGSAAELRVLAVAQKYQLSARLATPDEDYGLKTDVIVEGVPFQVSLSSKSKKSKKNLRNRGVIPIEAGEHCSEWVILRVLLTAIASV